ncbi:hypothetical protein [Flavobacterium sp.]|uniref:hypothetical protein n=1 Tax=Flavobacterium sp. TaxID=239 RepID=UPI00286E2E86|nr:hypothetical protein [Flavobacterium sp.]
MRNICYVVLTSLLLSSCKGYKEKCLINLDNKLAPLSNKEIVQGEVLNFRDSLDCFEWDALLFESGYGTKESIQKDYGVNIPYYYHNSSVDTKAIIFFLKNKVAVNHIEVERACYNTSGGISCKSYDFTTLIANNPKAIVSKKNAVFEVYTQDVKDNQGNSWQRENAIRIKK